ncbi:MAG TPA: LytTR family DNA-binding domain-containing protein [Gemmatimonadaceae bacterium]|nr:LytTR family DNA-binding domain-containing protein [Gemmatimonadaceae bacterium]
MRLESSPRLRTLIVDDEPPARERLRLFLADEPEIEIVGECGSGDDALGAIERESPDLVFLDIQMPIMDGFEVLASLDADRLPGVIFATAYDQYALRAFDVHAIDYLLKPFTRERLHEAVRVALDRLARRGAAGSDPALRALLDAVRESRRARPRITVRTDGRVLVLQTADIDWVEAAANYVRIHARGESHALRESMKNMEAKLPPELFIRIHRSAIVNVDRIRELQPWFHGEVVVILRDGTRLIASRAFVERLHAAIG